ncbi:MAG: ABC transporter substrate-binding protein [Ghiorsea sp.]
MMAPGLNADITAALNTVGISSKDFIRQNTRFGINDLIKGNTDAFSNHITDQPYQLDLLGVKYRIFHPKDQGIELYGDILITTENERQRFSHGFWGNQNPSWFCRSRKSS